MAIGTRVHKDESARESNYWLCTSHVNGAGHTGACTIFVPPARGEQAQAGRRRPDNHRRCCRSSVVNCRPYSHVPLASAARPS